MKKPHIHAVELRAFADGERIQRETRNNEGWIYEFSPSFLVCEKYRVEPHKWQKEIDAQKSGKAVQARGVSQLGHNNWIDVSEWMFEAAYMEFRVKPITFRYRIGAMQQGDGQLYPSLVDCLDDESALAKLTYFVKWITDWQEVEV